MPSLLEPNRGDVHGFPVAGCSGVILHAGVAVLRPGGQMIECGLFRSTEVGCKLNIPAALQRGECGLLVGWNRSCRKRSGLTEDDEHRLIRLQLQRNTGTSVLDAIRNGLHQAGIGMPELWTLSAHSKGCVHRLLTFGPVGKEVNIAIGEAAMNEQDVSFLA